MRRLLSEFIVCLRERPFSYKIAYCQALGLEGQVDAQRLWRLYDATEYLMGRVVLTDAIRRHSVEVPSTFLRHIVATGNRYLLKSLLLILRERRSTHTLMRVVRHPLCQDDPLMRHLLIQAARAHGVDPNSLDLYFNTEEAEFTEEERRIWSLWQPLDELIYRVNDASDVTPDTLRLMLWDNQRLLAEELARDLSDVFNIGHLQIQMLDRRQLVNLLAKYIDLSYLLCKAFAEDDFDAFEERLAEEDSTKPPSVLLPTAQTDQVNRAPFPPEEGSAARRSAPPGEEEFPEERLLGEDEEGADTSLSLADLTFDPAWKRWIPRDLANELLVVPLHVDGDPPESMTIGCANRDPRQVTARLAFLNCKIHIAHLPEQLVREALNAFYR